MFGTVEKHLKKDKTFRGKIREAKIFLARCWVRNYQNIEEAYNFLQRIMFKSKTSRIQDLLNGFNANLTLVELIMLHKTHLSATIPRILTKLRFLSNLIFTLRCSGEQSRQILLDLYVLELESKKYDRNFCDTRFSCLSIWCNNDPDFLHLFSKTVLRQGKVIADVMQGLVDVCNEVGRYGNVEWNVCSLANAYYVIGESYFLHSNEKAIAIFEKCFTLQQERLGSKHVLTAKAQFQLGRSLVQFRDKSLPSDPSGLNLMKKALANFSNINSGKFEFNSFGLEVLARFLALSGGFRKSVFYYSKSFGSANLLCYRQKIVTMFRKLELAKVFQQYNQWLDAIKYYKSFLDEIPNETYPLQVAQCHSLIGYCYFKLNQDSEAEQNFPDVL